MIPLVLVHGFMGGSAQWQHQIPAFSAGREVFAVDLPGFGARNRSPAVTSVNGFAEDVLAGLDAAGIGQFDLLGHSMGGMIVQQMIRLEPRRVNRLVLYGTGPRGRLPGRFETIAESKARAESEGIQASARRISATWFEDREAAAEYPACAEIAERTGLLAFQGGLTAMDAWDGADWLKDIAAPTLILWGDGDRTYQWAQVEELWRKIPDARLAVVPGCAHAVHLEKPGIFSQLVLDFLGNDTSQPGRRSR
ncbi:alpha/beta hydrolase [uncultured Roseobacter sp.]|uniref:alpha/beta fold hydrolase n=1 Tax=uncultured Roseobacter sp. TaxID=114847 RepID=UPI00262BF4C4|nr:alpha/beta hydrolase [uncultured Roseobacter sp.]